MICHSCVNDLIFKRITWFGDSALGLYLFTFNNLSELLLIEERISLM